MEEETKNNSQRINCGEISTHSSLSTTPYVAPLLRFNVRVNGNEADLMVDSGSSSNFISTSFAQRHGMRMSTLVTKQIVQLADGSTYEVRRHV